jgi:protein-disulfide isomerase
MTTKDKPHRQSTRAQRAQKKRQQRRIIAVGMVLTGVVIVLLLALPTIIQARKPVGEIIIPEFKDRIQTDFNTMGDPTAPVKIVEYSDFKCSFCKRFSDETEALLIENYINTGRVYFIYVPYGPGGKFVGRESEAAALAAFCAAEQGKFWEFKDIIFANYSVENTGDFTDKRLVAFAEALELDMDQFTACFGDEKYKDKLNEGIAEGLSFSISGTPYFIFNDGIASLRGAYPYQSFVDQIEALLNQ